MKDITTDDLTRKALTRKYLTLKEDVICLIDAANAINVFIAENYEHNQELENMLNYYDTLVDTLDL